MDNILLLIFIAFIFYLLGDKEKKQEERPIKKVKYKDKEYKIFKDKINYPEIKWKPKPLRMSCNTASFTYSQYASFKKSEYWKLTKEYFKEYYIINGRHIVCEDCGHSRSLKVHHRRYNNMGRELESVGMDDGRERKRKKLYV
jgi:hypothetical protein